MPTTVVSILIDIAPIVAAMEDFQREQAPFAASRAVNDVADMAVMGERAAMQTNFTIRRPWVLNGVKVLRYSNKKDEGGPYAVLGIADDRAFLNKFEQGGVKTPRGANLAMPTTAVRPSLTDIAPGNLRPRAFGTWQNRRGNDRTFIILTGPGAGIWQRVGRGANAIRMLWSYKQAAMIAPLLKFEETARGVIDKWFRTRFYLRMDEALKTARLK
jgi:hypothetical protein